MKKRRWKILLLISLSAIILGWALKFFYLDRPVGSGPAGPIVAREPFRKTWTERPVLLVGLGNSVTAGFGVSEGLSYFDRLIENPKDEFPEMQGVCLSSVFPNLQTLNIAISGSNSIQHLDTIKEQLPLQDEQTLGIVVLTSGGNDLIHWYGRMPPRESAMFGASLDQAQPWIAAFEPRLHEIIDIVEERFPGGCHVFVADIYDPTDGVGADHMMLPSWKDGLEIHRQYNEIIHRCAEQRSNVHLVPMYEEFLGHGAYCTQFFRKNYQSEDPHYWFGENLEDPNARGYDAIRRIYLIEMAKISEKL